MKFRKKDETNFIKVGIFISLLTFVIMAMIVSIGKENSLFESKIELRAHVENVQNLKEGAYVELKGIRVGAVHSIHIINEDQVEIRFTMLESQFKWLKRDSKVSISTAGLVGDKYLEIYDGTKTAESFNPQTDVLTPGHQSDMKQIMTKGESIATITERLLLRLDTILLNMDDGKKIVESMNALHKSSLNIEKISTDMREAQIGQMVKNVNSSMAKLEKASGSMEKIMSRIENGPGTMNSLIYDDSLHDDLRALLGGASRNKVIKYFIRESIKGSERQKAQPEN
jgi:phospholipid/cholesterol/gamma-HCH transport system substrate-binding protein